jgi:hypothetical protein
MSWKKPEGTRMLWRQGCCRLSGSGALGRCYDHGHPFAFQFGRGFDFSEIFQVFGQAIQKFFPLVAVYDVPSLELDCGLYLVAILQKSFGVAFLEFIVVIIGLRPEPQFLQDNDMLLLFCFLFLLLFLEKVFAVIHDLAYRWIGIWCNFDKIKIQTVSQFHGLRNRQYGVLIIGLDDTYHFSPDSLVYSLLRD